LTVGNYFCISQLISFLKEVHISMSESKVQLRSKADLFFVKGVLFEEALKAGKDLKPKENKELDKVFHLLSRSALQQTFITSH
jgi:hypothetical protein